MKMGARDRRALCAETHEEWSTGRWYLNMDEYFQWRDDSTVAPPPTKKLNSAENKLLNPPLYLPKLKIFQKARYTILGA